ncbi:MAG: replication initiator protein A [Oscillibacter sp.]|nr:replication initiator protein A [Oscillibacter sp.]
MRAAQMTERPGFTLMTQNDVQNTCYMQMPRWLFSDPRYAVMSLNAKVAYTFLLNRFQLSRMNGWVNDQGEVFVVFPRKELSKELRICEQKVTSAFRELVNLDLVWEKRCGRGEANQIYLAKVNPQSNPSYSCAPFIEMPEDSETEYSSPEDARTAEMEVLADDEETAETVETVEEGSDLDAANEQDEEVTDTQVNPHGIIPAESPDTSEPQTENVTLDEAVSGPEHRGTYDAGTPTPTQEPQNLRVKNRRICGPIRMI